jgi:hypothetical protein
VRRIGLLVAVAALLVAAAACGGDSGDSSATPTSSDPDVATTEAPTSTTQADVSDKAKPPSLDDFPRGDQLFSGSSGDNQIGCIACDGGTRFLHPNGTSTDIASGAPGPSPVADKWEITGHVVAFGANLHTPDNVGRYGIALFRNARADPTAPAPADDSPYRAGCAIEVGHTSCRSNKAGAELVPGDMVSISIGEAGNVKAKGDYSIDWWFVFEPVSDG